MKVLVAYATGHGATAEIGQAIRDALRAHGLEADARNVSEVDNVKGYSAFVIGSPIYGNMWRTEFSQFLEKHTPTLAASPTYMFISCIRVLEPDGKTFSLENYVYWPMLHKAGIQSVEVFPGKLDLAATDFNERWTLSARWDMNTPPDMHVNDFRDWNAIKAWADHIAADLRSR